LAYKVFAAFGASAQRRLLPVALLASSFSSASLTS